MTENLLASDVQEMSSNSFQGIYGPYTITSEDRIEVQRYRYAVLFCSISFAIGLIQWFLIGPQWAWIWLISMGISLGFALKWIHIYLIPLHNALKALWLIGCISIILIFSIIGPQETLSNVAKKPLLQIAIGPLFAALTGLGFKEFFCFRRLEAVGVTLLLPIALLGSISNLLSQFTATICLSIAALLFLILSIRKFGMEHSADIGDKSVFDFINKQKTNGHES